MTPEGGAGPASENCATLDELFASGAIHAVRTPIFEVDPPRLDVDYDRVEGMMLGLAIGDALGNTTEGQLPSERARAHGEIRDYLPNRYAGDRRVGLPSDDSQLAFRTLEQLIADGGYIPARLAQRFCKDPIFGIGGTVREFVERCGDGVPWYESGPRSAGNGALMRIAPMLFPQLRTVTRAFWSDVALSTMTTHNDCAAIAASVGFAGVLWDLLAMRRVPPQDWWLERFLELATGIDAPDTYAPRGGIFQGEASAFTTFVGRRVRDAKARGLTFVDAANEWYSGAFLLETMPSVLYCLMLHGDSPEEAMVRAVNDTKDNDTVGAIVGAAMGALHGKRGLPARWVEGLSGRTLYDDDGHMFALLDDARRVFHDGA